LDGQLCRTIPQLNTPFNNPDQEQGAIVEVTDPTHPLFGRHFSIITFSIQPNAQFVSVIYRGFMALRIPLAATNLVPARPRVSTKLTLAAVRELISVAEAEEVICQLIPKASGSISPLNCEPQSLPSSQSPSRK
jgi:hypothetical protein